MDFSKFERTYNKPIDLCANLIECARRNNTPLKALHLKPIYYEWFRSGVQTLMGRGLIEGEMLQFDGVDINLGSKFQSDNIILEYYEPIRS